MDDRRARGRGALYFAFFGGATAWTLHLVLSYVIAEFACLAQLDDVQVGGVTLIAWSLLALSVLMLGITLAAALAGWQALRRLQGGSGGRDDEATDAEIHFARSGAIMSGIFVVVIVCQTVPIFYYLGSC